MMKTHTSSGAATLETVRQRYSGKCLPQHGHRHRPLTSREMERHRLPRRSERRSHPSRCPHHVHRRRVRRDPLHAATSPPVHTTKPAAKSSPPAARTSIPLVIAASRSCSRNSIRSGGTYEPPRNIFPEPQHERQRRDRTQTREHSHRGSHGGKPRCSAGMLETGVM